MNYHPERGLPSKTITTPNRFITSFWVKEGIFLIGNTWNRGRKSGAYTSAKNLWTKKKKPWVKLPRRICAKLKSSKSMVLTFVAVVRKPLRKLAGIKDLM